ncbi:MAG: molybdopterin synthase catalytic subunit MoaE [Alphaproteobacteria bacterium]|nr:molybdopterin synthase catalytic subunit MoaE [Alphaproteobacteria bacterium]
MIRVQRQDFDVGTEIEALTRGRTDVGAVVSFTGQVRDDAEGDRLKSMTLEHFPGMTERELMRVEEEARVRWPLLDVLIVHRHGELLPGDRIVLVATLSHHRSDAFEAALFLMDYLKTRAPFWKRELRESGERWVEARGSDDEAAARWR